MPETEPLLTVPQVAALVGRSVRTVHRAIDLGELVPAMRAGAADNAPYLIKQSEAQRWIAERNTEATA